MRLVLCDRLMNETTVLQRPSCVPPLHPTSSSYNRVPCGAPRTRSWPASNALISAGISESRTTVMWRKKRVTQSVSFDHATGERRVPRAATLHVQHGPGPGPGRPRPGEEQGSQEASSIEAFQAREQGQAIPRHARPIASLNSSTRLRARYADTCDTQFRHRCHRCDVVECAPNATVGCVFFSNRSASDEQEGSFDPAHGVEISHTEVNAFIGAREAGQDGDQYLALRVDLDLIQPASFNVVFTCSACTRFALTAKRRAVAFPLNRRYEHFKTNFHVQAAKAFAAAEGGMGHVLGFELY